MIYRRYYKLFTTSEYDDWLFDLTIREQLQIDKRICLIELEGYFGDHKSVSIDNAVWELRWNNGRRVYYAFRGENHLLLLNGGNKNGQNSDISKAKSINVHYP
jgi:putative addiction module killer protein